METILEGVFNELFCSKDPFVHPDVNKCPFLRNINEATNFPFGSIVFPAPVSSLQLFISCSFVTNWALSVNACLFFFL